MMRAIQLGLLAISLASTNLLAQNPKDVRNSTVVDVVKRVGPAVVNVSTATLVRNPYMEDAPNLFEWFFGAQPQQRGRKVQNSLGSGVIVDPEGYVLTNDHVIQAASEITITFQDGRQVPAKVVGADSLSDLAVLKLEGKGPWPYVPFGSSDGLLIGETAIAIGNPFGLNSTVTAGVISAVGRALNSPEDDEVHYTDFVQTDAANNPGNSGGALLNSLGELIGINTAIVARGQNLGFAIPIDRALRVFKQLVRHGRVRPIWTGLLVDQLTPRMADELGVELKQGVLVQKQFRDSPAVAADVRVEDVIVQVGGLKITSLADYETALARATPGQAISLTIHRGGKELVKSLIPINFPKERATAVAWNSLGIEVQGRRGGLEITKIRPNSYLARRRVPAGIGLLELNGREVGTIEQFSDAMADAVNRSSATMVVTDGRQRVRISVPMQ
jgi:S1-C subfamily serine protease